MESTQPQKQQKQKDIVFIRHAESLLNIASHNYRIQHNLPYIWEQLSKHESFLSDVKYNPDFVDCKITQKGIQQCIKARQYIKDLNPDLILVSPLRRTLQTCDLIFQSKNIKIPIIVEPILAEAFRSSCDISDSIEEKVSQYPQFDFLKVKEKGDFWFIENESQQNKKQYNEILQRMKDKSFKEKQKAVLQYMIKTMIFEKPKNVRKRAQIVKQILVEYKKKYNKIVIVSHYNIINYACCTQFSVDNQPWDSLDVKNCQVYQTSLKHLLKFK